MKEPIKFTEEEVGQINLLRQEVSQIFIQLGQLTLERKKRLEELDNFESQLQQSHQSLVEKEQEIFKSLNEKYGDGNYDPTTGIFTPLQDENQVTQ
jgi:predicted nuclease with TOPRIM domain